MFSRDLHLRTSLLALALLGALACGKSSGKTSSSSSGAGTSGTSATAGSTASSSSGTTGSGSSSSGSTSGSSGSSGSVAMCTPCLTSSDCGAGQCITEGISSNDWFCASPCDPNGDSSDCPSGAHCFTFPGGGGCFPETGTCLPPGSTGGSGSTGSNCTRDGEWSGDATLCCSGTVDPNGYCGQGSGTTSGPPHLGPGPCPENIPNINTGQTAVGGVCNNNPSAPKCPSGFSCVDNYCVLNGGAGPVQVTLSWDYPEDLDLHVIEPQDGGPEACFSDNVAPCIFPDPGVTPNQCANGFPASFPSDYTGQGCEIWYGNIGPRPGDPGSGDCEPIGWLDRDSDPGCSFDGINIENVIYATGVPAPVGTYMVRVDYYTGCAGDTYLNGATVAPYPNIPYAVQVRSNGQVQLYCDSFPGQSSNNGSEGTGKYIQSFIQLNIWPDGGLEFPPDAGPVDAGPADAGPDDAGAVDAGPDDAGPDDAGPVDAGPDDAGAADAG
ncbi:MAG: hypothetical protein JST54_04040 [Deltaproteobacteria bacterium]|nr:hypothetical protein [Deltaproteobacteria bacterium]